MRGGGTAVGGGCFFGLTGGGSTAKTICGFGSYFVEYSSNAGLGPGGGFSVFSGKEGNTPVIGGSFSGGIGVGEDSSIGITFTGVTPLFGRKNTCESGPTSDPSSGGGDSPNWSNPESPINRLFGGFPPPLNSMF